MAWPGHFATPAPPRGSGHCLALEPQGSCSAARADDPQASGMASGMATDMVMDMATGLGTG